MSKESGLWAAGNDGPAPSRLFVSVCNDVGAWLASCGYAGPYGVAKIILHDLAYSDKAPWPELRQAIRESRE